MANLLKQMEAASITAGQPRSSRTAGWFAVFLLCLAQFASTIDLGILALCLSAAGIAARKLQAAGSRNPAMRALITFTPCSTPLELLSEQRD